jgi:hypothetical protein
MSHQPARPAAIPFADTPKPLTIVIIDHPPADSTELSTSTRSSSTIVGIPVADTELFTVTADGDHPPINSTEILPSRLPDHLQLSLKPPFPSPSRFLSPNCFLSPFNQC